MTTWFRVTYVLTGLALAALFGCRLRPGEKPRPSYAVRGIGAVRT